MFRSWPMERIMIVYILKRFAYSKFCVVVDNWISVNTKYLKQKQQKREALWCRILGIGLASRSLGYIKCSQATWWHMRWQEGILLPTYFVAYRQLLNLWSNNMLSYDHQTICFYELSFWRFIFSLYLPNLLLLYQCNVFGKVVTTWNDYILRISSN